MINKMGLIVTETIELFKYGTSNEGYWDEPKFYKQVVNKAISITEALYPGYLLLFF